MAETPLTRSEILSRAFDADIWLKNECASPIASFKLRGALCDLVRARERGAPEGVVASSSGNHGQGVAWCARRLGGAADIFVPEGTNALKRGMIAAFGGRVHEVGSDIDYARAAAIRHAEEGGLYFVNDGISLDVMEGAATLALEVVRGLDRFDDLVIPTGGGNLAAGCAALLAEMRPGARVIAVQPEAAPVIVRSFREGRPLEVPGASVADGLVSRETIPFAFEVFSRYVAEGWLCGERDILAGRPHPRRERPPARRALGRRRPRRRLGTSGEPARPARGAGDHRRQLLDAAASSKPSPPRPSSPSRRWRGAEGRPSNRATLTLRQAQGEVLMASLSKYEEPARRGESQRYTNASPPLPEKRLEQRAAPGLLDAGIGLGPVVAGRAG